MKVLQDTFLEYEDGRYTGGGKGVTRLRVYQHEKNVIALVSELYKNPGPSITNAAEAVIEAIVQKIPDIDRIIEHYPSDKESGLDETFSEMHIDSLWKKVRWRYLQVEEVKNLLGGLPQKHLKTDEPAWLELHNTKQPRNKDDIIVTQFENFVKDFQIEQWIESFGRRRAVSYIGGFDPFGRAQIVRISPKETSLVHHYVRHSPGGFSWGYFGSGPSEAARCILADALGKKPDRNDYIKIVDDIYDVFKEDVVAQLPQKDPWIIKRNDIVAWVKNYKKDEINRFTEEILLNKTYL